MKLNVAVSRAPIFTHEGAPATHLTPLQSLKRSVGSCLLWESEFYEDGQDIASRIAKLVHECRPEDVAFLAIEAREQMNLRHVPLLLLRELARHPKIKDRPKLVSTTLGRVVQRADELTEFLAIYWKDGKKPLAKQVKRGLAWAFRKFSEYDLAKYNRDGAVKLRDVLFLTHAKPKDEYQAKLWKRLAQNELVTPDTWEVALSAGADKRETFDRLIRERKLGALALLRNLRNMQQAGVDTALIAWALEYADYSRVLPFRFIAAARHAPQLEPQLDAAMQKRIAELPKLQGRTFVLVDVSGSMQAPVSGKSDLTRNDAACGVAIVARGLIADCRVFAFSDNLCEIPARSGMALKDAILHSMPHGGTNLGAAIAYLGTIQPAYERLIVITDEQSHDRVPAPHSASHAYMINVASARNGVGYGPWTHIDGFSESVIRFIAEVEQPRAGA